MCFCFGLLADHTKEARLNSNGISATSTVLVLLWRTPPYSVDKLPTDPNSSPPALFLVKMILNVAASTSCRIEIIDPPARLPGDMIAAACFAVKLRGELSEAKCTSSKPPPKLCIPSSSGFCGRYLQPECSTAPAPTPGMLTGHNYKTTARRMRRLLQAHS